MARFLLDGRLGVGGVGRYRDELIAALCSGAPEHEFLLVTRRGRLRLGLDAPFTPWAARAVATRAVRWAADLVHGLHMEVPKVASVPSIVTVPDLIPLEFPATMRNPVHRARFRRVLAVSLRRATRLIAPSSATASALVRHGASAAKIVVVPIGIGSPFEPIDEARGSTARDRFGNGGPYIASVAEPRPHKNRGGLFAAAKLLPRVTFACRGTYGAGAPENVFFVPPLGKAELALFYGGAEALLMTSFIEGYGLPALEAAACGTPVLCGPGVGVLPYLGAGLLLIDPLDPDGMARRLETFLRDGHLKRELSEAARKAASKLTPQAMARATLDVYLEALGET
jgi:glycosyltransferase involved in cell wall biosynthesis